MTINSFKSKYNKSSKFDESLTEKTIMKRKWMGVNNTQEICFHKDIAKRMEKREREHNKNWALCFMHGVEDLPCGHSGKTGKQHIKY